MKTYALAIHGGSGTILRSKMGADMEAAYTLALENALIAGEEILAAGGSACDAVVAAVVSLENCPLFNAGIGAVFTHDHTHELDASIMDGRERKAGAVASVKHIENPILLAKEVMNHSQHVMLIGEGAERFAQKQGFPLVDNTHFSTTFRKKQLEEIHHLEKTQLDHSDKEEKFGTVGAVALDKNGNLAAATSTGGMTNKRFGRVGDTPLIGAGTYADNEVCAVSATGWGEFFIRGVVAYDVAALMKYGKMSLEEATHQVIMENLKNIPPLNEGDGGLIAVDKEGNVSLPFNTEGMYRGYVKEGEEKVVSIFR
ncbi:MAG: isoaspartyl peptidase/L-asparaginase family protein [Bacteroidia bacterium]